MYKISYEPQFQKDYKRFKQSHPELVNDFRATVSQFIHLGAIDEHYRPHILNKRGGNYNNYYEYHLSDGKVDVLVIYSPHKSNPIIRFVRIGSHSELFQGSEK